MNKAEWDNKACADLNERSLRQAFTEMAKIQASGIPLFVRPTHYILFAEDIEWFSEIKNLDETEVSND